MPALSERRNIIVIADDEAGGRWGQTPKIEFATRSICALVVAARPSPPQPEDTRYSIFCA